MRAPRAGQNEPGWESVRGKIQRCLTQSWALENSLMQPERLHLPLPPCPVLPSHWPKWSPALLGDSLLHGEGREDLHQPHADVSTPSLCSCTCLGLPTHLRHSHGCTGHQRKRQCPTLNLEPGWPQRHQPSSALAVQPRAGGFLPTSLLLPLLPALLLLCPCQTLLLPDGPRAQGSSSSLQGCIEAF